MDKVRWRINMLGRLSAERGERHVDHFKTNKTGLLLACLAYGPRRRYRREELVEQLWPGEDPELGRNNLRVALAHLRQVLEPSAEERGAMLAADREIIFLRGDSFVTDSEEFERCLAQAAEQTDDAGRARHLEAAVRLYQAEFLPDFDAVWISGERLRLAEAYHSALASLARAYSALGQFERALEAAQTSVKVDPHREEAHRLIMQILALMGKPHAALRQYRELEARLGADDGRTPSRRTQVVIEDLCRRSGVSRPASPDVALPALAPPTMPDKPPSPPTTSDEAASPPLTTDRAPSAEKAAFRVPMPLTGLVGREDEVERIADILEAPETRLLTLTGLGGVGKTRLALGVAYRLRRDDKRICYLSLTGAADCDFLISNLAEALQLPDAQSGDIWTRVIEYLSDSPTLLVLDNLEHLLPEAAAIVRRLLETAPSLVCLATSRQRIGLVGEREHLVPPLPIPSVGDGLADVGRCASVRLWLERVRAYQPQFEITREICADVVALCRRLDGLPLAIELAAAWSSVLPPAEVARLLDARFELLVSRDPTVESRHSSLKATLDWSFERLPDDAQASLARLAVFPDGWTLDAAGTITDKFHALEHILTLRERSLISADPSPGQARFRMPETVREYALSRLTSEEREAAQARLVAYYIDLAERAEPALKGADSADWMRRLTQELENLRGALRLALQTGTDMESALRLSLALFRYWYIGGFVREGRDWMSAALARASQSCRGRDRALMALGNLAYADGDLAAAEQHYGECRKLREAAGDTAGVAATLGSLLNIRHRQGELIAARALAQQSLGIYRRLGDARGQALILGNLALVAKSMGDDPGALELGEQAIAAFRSLSDMHNLMTGLANLSITALRVGRTERAAELLRESLNLTTTLSSSVNLTYVLSNAARLAHERKAYPLCVQLRAAAASLRAKLKIVRPQDVQETIDQELESLHVVLGDEAYAREWQQGYRLTEASAINLLHSFLADDPIAA